jgi:hypothetical protein
MNLDIRLPIGLLFGSLGVLLAIFGLYTQFTQSDMYARSLDININLWWGLVMLVFGGLMTLAGGRGSLKSPPVRSEASGPRPGAH